MSTQGTPAQSSAPLSLAKTSNVLIEHSGPARSQRLRSQGSRVKTMMVQIRLVPRQNSVRAGNQQLAQFPQSQDLL